MLTFEKSFASHPKSQFWSDRNTSNPTEVSKYSHHKFWFLCGMCNHEFENRLDNVNSGYWCPFCANKSLCDDTNCLSCHNKSFASHENSQYWSDKNILTPRQVLKGSKKKLWFLCNICNHEFEQVPSAITNRGRWCPFCTNQKLCQDSTCTNCNNKSFASHIKVNCWSDRNTLNPREVFKSSNSKIWFLCDTCNHEFENCPGAVNGRGRWCPYCGKKQLCSVITCMTCFNNSFASHEKSNYWSERNTMKPREVFKGSSNKFWFNCDQCTIEFECRISNITCNDRWCPYCVNKTEKLFFEKLSKLYSLQQQAKFDWCKNKKYLPFDFCIPECKIIIELDGRQHFEQVENWVSPENQKAIDKYKMKCANENGYSMIRILQRDVLNNTYDWLKELQYNIEKLKTDDIVQNIFMCKNNEYREYQQ
jgi:very-short-patch-repair endonuclease